MRALSFSLHTIAVIAIALAFQGLTTAPAGASTLTACLEDGELEDVAQGLSPLEPCDDEATQVTWEVAGTCPCDIQGMAGLAGWGRPECEVVNDPPLELSAELEGAGDRRPFALLNADVPGDPRCITVDDADAVVDDVSDLDGGEVAACFADLDELAISLGLVGGCSPF